MSGWPWPLDGVQKWFENLWSWISKAAVSAVSVVSKWIIDAVGGLWKDVNAAFTAAGKALSGAVNGLWKDVNDAFTAAGKALSGAFDSLWVNIVKGFSGLWDSISSSISGLWDSVSTAFSDLWSSVSGAVDGLWTNLVDFFGNLWDSISAGLSGLWTSISGAVDSAVTSIGSGLSSLWTGIVDTVGKLWNSVSTGLAAVGNAVGGAVNTIGTWVSDAMKGVAAALGIALQATFDWLWKGLSTVSGIIVNGLNEYVVKPLMGAFNWIIDAVTGVLRSLYDSLLGVLKGAGAGTPEGVAALAVPLLLISSGGSFTVGAMGAVTGIKVVGTGVDTGGIVDSLKDAFGLGEVSQSIFRPMLAAAYVQPIQYYYNAMFRPRIPDTRTADQMLFEEHIDESEWRQIYRYNGWKEQHIDAWFKTMWREPSLLVLRNLVLDPDVDEAWVRKKMREGGLIGEDADAIIAYGKRQSLKDERSALASQVQTDLIDGVIIEADARADLSALKFTPGEIDYRIARCTLIVARNERRAALKAVKNFTEADLKQEVALGLRTHGQFIADIQTMGYSAAIAERKYTLITTAKPLTTEEIERRKVVAENKVARVNRRYALSLARLDQQAASISTTIENAAEESAASLTVVDMEIAAIRSEIAGITPDVLTEPLRKKIAATRRRYERALALLDQREARLVEEVAATQTLAAETLDIIDVEALFIRGELEELGVVT